MKFDIVKSRWAIVYIEGSQVIISKKMYYFFWRSIFLANSAYTDELSH